jgi:hypothetical protein
MRIRAMGQSAEGVPLPANYESKLPVRAGLLAGLLGALSIMVVVAALLVLSGRDIWAAARLIAVVVYGPDAVVGLAPIVVGTIIHLLTGSTLGAVFAWVLPCLPRNIWVVAGLVYGIAAWLVSTFIVLPVVAPPMIAADANVNVLLLAHVIYGLALGVAGATYNLWWALPATLSVD